ncbi:MAG: lysine--tRNA ligase, partial [Clostridia bacterium]|nr:lysine--tRNA ligase [Clostridia bacterium]
MQNNQNNTPLTEEEERAQLIEQAQIRREKLAKLTAEGNNPYEKTKYTVTESSLSVKEKFETLEGKEVCIAGRLMSRRIMGKASFCHVSDRDGLIQIYVRRDDIGEDVYASFKKDYDIGDIVGVKGFVFKTQTGEISVHCTHIEMLSKALLPLPEKQHGLTNADIRYRQRDLDLIVNPDVKKTFIQRSKILKEIRAYLDGMGYLEVDTPVLTTLEIGAAARPFKTRHNALDID